MIKRSLQFIINTICIVLILSAVFLGISFLLGLRPYIVKSGSMEPSIKTGSLVFVDTKTPFSQIENGDVVAFSLGRDTLVTHRVISRTDSMLETKGDNNDVSDGFSVSEENYRGETLFPIPYLGFLFLWIQTKKGRILAITGVVAFFLIDILLAQSEKS